MAVNWNLGHAATNYFTVRVRGSSLGVATVQTSTGIYSAVVDPTVADGNALITVPWSIAGASIPITVTVDGASETGIAQTYPTSGSFSVAFGTCWDRRAHFLWTDFLLSLRQLPVMFLWPGDLGYSEFALNAYGINFPGVSAGGYASFLDNSRLAWRQTFSDPRIRRLFSRIPLIMQMDDHDQSPGNNGPRTTLANLNLNGLTLTTQEEVDQIVNWCVQAFSEYGKGQPAYATSYEPNALYSTWKIQDVRFVLLDTTMYRDNVEVVQSDTKRMLSAAQEQWLYDTLSLADYSFVVIVSPKEIWRDSFNNDGWHQYSHQRTRILSWINANVTNACVLFVTGDVHNPCMAADSIGNVEIKSSPLGNNNLNTGDGYDTNIVRRSNGYYGRLSTANNNIGLLEFDGSECVASLNYIDGRRHAITLSYGQKGIVFPEQRFAF